LPTDKLSCVRSFLRAVKLALQKNSPTELTLTFSTIREKNMNTLAVLEMDVEDSREVVLSLTPDDYCSGPCKDSDIKGNLWVFGKRVKGKEVYIKLKLSGDERSQSVRILSFHFPERPLKYHFRLSKKERSIR